MTVRSSDSWSSGVSITVGRTTTCYRPSSWSGDDCEEAAACDAAWRAAYFADNDLACRLEIAITALEGAFKGSCELRFAPRLQAVLDELRALRQEANDA